MADLLSSLLGFGGLAASAYLPYEKAGEAYADLERATNQFASSASQLGSQAARETQFSPFGVRTASGGYTTFDPYGGMTQRLGSTEQALQNRMLSQAYNTFGSPANYSQYGSLRSNFLSDALRAADTAGADTGRLQSYGTGLLGQGYNLAGQAGRDTLGLQNVGNTYMQQVQQAARQGIDPRQFEALQRQALFQAEQGLKTGTPTQAELFQQMQDARAGAQSRDRLALENRLAAQGRLGVQTAAFGGTPEALAMEKAFQEQASQDFLSASTMADQLRSSNIAQSQGLFGLGQQAAMTPQQLESMRLQNVGQMSNIGMGALGLGSQMTAQDYANAAQLYGMGTGSLGLGSQMTAQDYANAQGLFGMGMQAGMAPSQLEQMRLANQMGALQSAYLPQQQMLTALSPSLNLQGMLANRDIAGANALTQAGMAGLEARMGGLSAMSQLEVGRVNALADALQGLFSASSAQKSPLEQLIGAIG